MERYFHEEAFPVASDNPEGYVQNGFTKLEHAALLIAAHSSNSPQFCVKRAIDVLDEVNGLREVALKEDLSKEQGRRR